MNNNIQLSANALTVLERRYLAKDPDGRVAETPGDMFMRVARFIAEGDRGYGAAAEEIEKTTAAFFDLMTSLSFLPNSPTLMNAGRPLGQLSACFVLPVGDSMEEIFEANKHAALIHKSGGGTGFSFSRLRPRNSIVASTKGVASGPVSFMRVFDASTDAVKQGGTRRGANMGVLRVDHPDILEFIAAKDNLSEINNFNISVAVTDTFMRAVADDTRYPLLDPRTGGTWELDGQQQTLNAREVFDRIVQHAWATGEPGIVFIDRMNQANPTYPVEQIEATNPCGEQPLPPYDSCNLGSLNLSRFVKSPLSAGPTLAAGGEGIDWDRLAEAVRVAVHFLDNVIDQNQYPIPQIEAQTRKNRRIGLGVMGFADLLVLLGMPYGSPESIGLGEQIMAFVQTEARRASAELARTRGTFPNWGNSSYARDGLAMRNCTVTTVAPTGTISIIAGCSSGIEPYYSLAYQRKVLDGTTLIEVNPYFERAARDGGFWTDELIDTVASVRSLREIEAIPEAIRTLYATAADIDPESHVRMQAAFQRHCDSSVSKTINLPTEASPDDIHRAYFLAYDLGCKGVTVYRDHSRPGQVLSPIGGEAARAEGVSLVAQRPDILQGFTRKIRTGYGNLYVTVNLRNGTAFEVFAHIGKSGYTTMADTEAICRMISLALRSGIPLGQIVRQLRGIGGSSQVFSGGSRVTSIPDAIAQVLEAFQADSGRSRQAQPPEICPSCGSAMEFDSGCYCCRSCGYSSC